MLRTFNRCLAPESLCTRTLVRRLAQAAMNESSAAHDESLASSSVRHTTIDNIPLKDTVFNAHSAVKAVKDACWAKFDESIDISVNLGVDPRKPNQAIKGVASLPHGNGKVVRVCVFATGDAEKLAKEAGADVVGHDDVIADIQNGIIEFDTVIATPEMMSTVGKVGRILGPRGLMPNPKLGTVTKDVVKAIKAAKSGAIKFKVERKGIVHAGIGKRSFDDEQLLDNIKAFMLAIVDAKPENLKGKYIKGVHISSTMGPGVTVDVPSVDPGSARFMLDVPPIIKK